MLRGLALSGMDFAGPVIASVNSAGFVKSAYGLVASIELRGEFA
jgi:hypothetical protein